MRGGAHESHGRSGAFGTGPAAPKPSSVCKKCCLGCCAGVMPVQVGAGLAQELGAVPRVTCDCCGEGRRAIRVAHIDICRRVDQHPHAREIPDLDSCMKRRCAASITPIERRTRLHEKDQDILGSRCSRDLSPVAVEPHSRSEKAQRHFGEPLCTSALRPRRRVPRGGTIPSQARSIYLLTYLCI